MARSSLEAFHSLWRAYGEGRLGESLDLVDPDCEVTLCDASSPAGDHVDRTIAFVAEFRDDRLVRGRIFDARDDAIAGAHAGHGADRRPA